MSKNILKKKKSKIDAYGIDLALYRKGKISFGLGMDYAEVQRDDHRTLRNPE